MRAIDAMFVWTPDREPFEERTSTKRIAVQVTFDNFGHAIQDVYATTLATTAPVQPA